MSKIRERNCRNCEYFGKNGKLTWCEAREITVEHNQARYCEDFIDKEKTEDLEHASVNKDRGNKAGWKKNRRAKEFMRRMED